MYQSQIKRDTKFSKQLINMTRTLLKNWQIYLEIQQCKQASKKDRHRNIHFANDNQYTTQILRDQNLRQSYSNRKMVNFESSKYLRQQRSQKKYLQTPRTKLQSEYSDYSEQQRHQPQNNLRFSMGNVMSEKLLKSQKNASQKLIGSQTNLNNRYMNIKEVLPGQRLSGRESNYVYNKKIGTFKKQQNFIYAKQEGDYLRNKFLAHIERIHNGKEQECQLTNPKQPNK